MPDGRRCSVCGDWYLRANRFRAWTKHNPGARTGWEKRDEKICTGCMSATQASRVLIVASVRLVEMRRKRARG